VSHYKSKQEFEHPLKSQPTKRKEDITVKLDFESTAVFHPDSTEWNEMSCAHDQLNIEPIIRPKKQKWLGIGIVSCFMGLIAWQALDSLVTAYQHSNWLVLGWSVFLGGFSGLGVLRLIKEWRMLRRLKSHFSKQEMAEKVINDDGVGNAETLCRTLLPTVHDEQLSEAVERWNTALDPSYNDKEVFELYNAMIVKQQDDRAVRVVSKYSADSAVMVALSPLAIVDMLLVAWRSLKMLDELADIYQIELGYWSKLRLLKLVLINMAFAGVTELAIDSGMDVLSTNLVQKLSARAGQGVGVGLMTARLGIQSMKVMRPLPWLVDSKTSLAAVRKNIIKNVFKVTNKSQIR